MVSDRFVCPVDVVEYVTSIFPFPNSSMYFLFVAILHTMGDPVFFRLDKIRTYNILSNKRKMDPLNLSFLTEQEGKLY